MIFGEQGGEFNMEWWLTVGKAVLTGLIVGALFQALKLPVPVPTAFAGIAGIIAMFFGMLIWKFFFK